jgi:hypothetical protein
VGIHRKRLGDPLPYLGERCAFWGLGQAEDDVEGIVSIPFDRGIYNDRMKEFVEPFTYPLGRPRLLKVGEDAVETVLPLQGADIVATANYWHMGQILELGDRAQPRANMRHYFASMVHEGLVLDRDGLAVWLRSSDYAEKYS